MPMRVFEVDVEDDEAFADWFGPFHASDVEAWPDLPGWLPGELRAIARRRDDATWVLGCVADDGGATVGSSISRVAKLDNLDVVETFALCVHPQHRRRGAGSAMLRWIESLAADLGRATLVASTEVNLALEDTAGEAFAQQAGFERALASSRRELRLPVDPSLLDRLEAEARPHAADYELTTWTNGCPAAYVEGRLDLASGMSTDTPHGELDFDEERWDEQRLRGQEGVTAAMDRDSFAAGALHRPTGTLVAFTEIAISRVDPSAGWQQDTIVHTAHRGHRLGILVKVANLRAAAASSPQTTRVCTWNADENEPMVRVNELFGFKRVARCAMWQRKTT
jgi:GNAT superfamily N-acetyltransferase